MTRDSRGTRGSLGRAELGSEPLHRRTYGDWRVANDYNHIQEGDLHMTKRHLPPAWGVLHIARPIWLFGPGKRLPSPSNVR
jgi:predicted secreted hydrolase